MPNARNDKDKDIRRRAKNGCSDQCGIASYRFGKRPRDGIADRGEDEGDEPVVGVGSREHLAWDVLLQHRVPKRIPEVDGERDPANRVSDQRRRAREPEQTERPLLKRPDSSSPAAPSRAHLSLSAPQSLWGTGTYGRAPRSFDPEDRTAFVAELAEKS
jgi:hypothetical protein